VIVDADPLDDEDRKQVMRLTGSLAHYFAKDHRFRERLELLGMHLGVGIIGKLDRGEVAV